MADFPPPSVPAEGNGLTVEQAARLERLARRRPTPRDDQTETDTSTAARASRLERRVERSRTVADAARPATAGTRRPRRKHPAQGARAAALGMSLATTAGLAGIFATMSRPATAETAAVIVSDGSSRVTDLVAPSPAEPLARAGQDSQPTVVDGAVFRNKWGPVQVEATFAPDGTLADVTTLQTPDDRGRSVRINDYAVPRLNREALTVQSAAVDTVSGATYTSDGYRQSLQSAIDAARDAGVTVLA
jgi:uncharacterized protein with FMN-binding domain